ncbi:flagellar basal-body MS-ring/collar protein FliF [Alteribacter natronophilus]|uniref:flagellar basal-body MS-ring/collar protein FliF n=1 Tax=Alteribacter natronophilus TaxID=2583810 RepID=UPI00110DD7A3|nr:flagellar basal-body MS-ring/collar protein FliF [Alteribacter natronophilus]TMW73211.1 flagellar basal body M-ring protein FliF [Alteribacter natronophilus]
MNETITAWKSRTMEMWSSRTKKEKGILAGSVLLGAVLLIGLLMFTMRTSYAPLYTNLTAQETGEVKATLDARGVDSRIDESGSVIKVPSGMVDELKVELAAEGLPRSGSIDYSSFQENMGFGTTDKEFSVIERGLIQSELENLIRGIDGVQSAQVMVTMPEASHWLHGEERSASASVILHLTPGSALQQEQVRALYHLVSRSVPDLPEENIVMMDQMSRYYEYEDTANSNTALSAYEQQRQIRQDVERDIQRQLQQMLGTMMGPDKVLVSVSTDIDFTKENRLEELVTPVDEENMEGLAVSVERITETYTGNEPDEAGVDGTGETDIPGYPGLTDSGEGDYERIEERINHDFNRVTREIEESPYQVMDLGIQVMVEPPDPEDPLSLPQERLDDITEILSQVVRTSISNDVLAQWEENEIEERIFVSAQPFTGNTPPGESPRTAFSWWSWVIPAVLAVAVAVLVVMLLKRRKAVEESDRSILMENETTAQEQLGAARDSEEVARRKQLEKLAKEKPEEFSKLVRTWLSEE